MSTELVSVLVGGPGLVALVVAVIGFLQNRRTLRATQPKTEAERMEIEIRSLRSLLEEMRIVRAADKQDSAYRIAELEQRIKEMERRHKSEIALLYEKISAYLDEHAIPKPHWWPVKRHHEKPDLGGDQGQP